MTVCSGQEKRVEQSEMKRNATFGMPLVFLNNHRFSKCFTASLLLPTHHGFNSKAAEVISILLIYTSLQDYLIQVYLLTGQIVK